MAYKVGVSDYGGAPGQHNMGCSVRLLNGMTFASVKELEDLGKFEGIVLAVASATKGGGEENLKKAGYIPLLTYRNYNFHPEGTLCTLWAHLNEKSKVPVKTTEEPLKVVKVAI